MENKLFQRGNGTRQRVYDFIVEYIKKNGYAPTVREIGDAVNLKSTSSVFSHLLALKDVGKIEMKNKAPRAIKLVGYEFVEPASEEKELKSDNIPDFTTVKELANKMSVNPSKIAQWLFMNGKVASFDSAISYEDTNSFVMEYLFGK